MEKTDCCCCCSSKEPEISVKKDMIEGNDEVKAPDLISSGEETFEMGNTHRLTESAAANWELHREIIDETIKGGWDNKVHNWGRERQAFWRYPLAFSSYAIPSLIMIDNSKFNEAVDCLRKSVMLMKEVGIWEDWTRLEYGKDPVTTMNVMYKGHLNLMYALYTLISGDDQFEEELHVMTKILTSEYKKNAVERGFALIECEPDQVFPPCNSIALMSLLIYDILYGTDFGEEIVKPAVDFIKEKVSDRETGMPFFRYHPSHDYAEAVLIGDMWTLGMSRSFDNAHFERAYANIKKEFIQDIRGGKSCYLRAARGFDGVSTDHEQQMWGFYTPFAAKEYGDPELWEKINRYFRELYETEICEGKIKFNYGEKCEETIVSCYLFLGDVHQGWQNILNYDWKKLQSQVSKGM